MSRIEPWWRIERLQGDKWVQTVGPFLEETTARAQLDHARDDRRDLRPARLVRCEITYGEWEPVDDDEDVPS